MARRDPYASGGCSNLLLSRSNAHHDSKRGDNRHNAACKKKNAVDDTICPPLPDQIPGRSGGDPSESDHDYSKVNVAKYGKPWPIGSTVENCGDNERDQQD